jgi:uncharacterized protein
MGTLNPGRIAIVGAGAAGLTAAWLLRGRSEITLYEREGHLGGHARTVTVEDQGREIPLDLGFMVFNHRNYPRFTQLLNALGGIEISESEMSFGYFSPADRAGYVVNWAPGTKCPAMSSAAAVRDLLPELLGDILRFGRTARADLEADRIGNLSLGEYLGQRGFSQSFADRYAVAMGSAIWSTPQRSLKQFPAADFLRFFANHGLLTLSDPPQWLHIHGGSRRYVQAIRSALPDAARLRTPVERIERSPEGVWVRAAGRSPERFDHVILAVHADEVLALLANPNDEERAYFSAWRYERNEAILHTDVTVMPPDRALWASWNYCDEGDAADAPLSMTYFLNRLQALPDNRRNYFLTLNPGRAFSPEHVLGHYSFTHPTYSGPTASRRGLIFELNGMGGVWYCGSYMGDGFHEDAVRSGWDAATRLGGLS